AHGLTRRGIDVLTAEADGAASVPDDQILERSTSLGRIVYTQDRDFLTIAPSWVADGRDFSGIVYSRQNRLSNRAIIDDLELIVLLNSPDEMRNSVIHLPL